MIKLNTIHYPLIQDVNIVKEFSSDILKNNELYLDLEKRFLKKYSFSSLKTFSFTQDGFLGLLCGLQREGKIAISLGETETLIQAGKLYEDLGFEIIWIGLEKDGQIDFKEIEKLDVEFLFISSYIIDTFVKTDLREVQQKTKAKLISNGTVQYNELSDAVYFDPYKLTGFNSSGVIISDAIFKNQSIGFVDNIAVYQIYQGLLSQNFISTLKSKFKNVLQNLFADDIYFFVEPKITLEFTLHFGLKNIKARELIRTLSLDEILITNGEGCSLGLSQPSRIIQEMGYDKEISRNGISLSFSQEIADENIEKVCKLFYRRYKQIKVLT